MADDTEKDLDAAERALGTMPREDETLDEARERRAWEMRLAPLSELLPPIPPPDGLLERIQTRIAAEDGEQELVRVRRKLVGWRTATAAFALAAAVLLVFVALPIVSEPQSRYVAVATAEGGGPALIVEFDLADGIATVRPVGLKAPATGDFELWHIETGEAPRSLGLLTPGQPSQRPLAASPGDVIAVSLEPVGGSPSGQPTGPVVYSGNLVAVDE